MKNLHPARVFIALVSTLVLISILPLMVLFTITSPVAGLPDEISTTSSLVTRSQQLKAQSWNYEFFCKPREAQCQIGFYTSRQTNRAQVLWFDPGCMRLASGFWEWQGNTFDSFRTLLFPPKRLAISRHATGYKDEVFVTFLRSDDYSWQRLGVYYGDKLYDGTKNYVGSWESPGSHDELFTLTWFDC